MLEEFIEARATSQTGLEAAAKRRWNAFLCLKKDKCIQLCNEVVSFFDSRLLKDAAQDASNTPSKNLASVDAFVEVYLAALYAIHTGLATSLAWRTAQASRLGEGRLVSSEAHSACNTAAEFLIRICEKYFLRTRDIAQCRFQCLLKETGMGVPLLSVVLYAYSSAVTDVLANTNDDASRRHVDRCLEHLRMASEVFTLTNNDAKDQLTIAHPIVLHVMRVSGRVQGALQFFQQPVRSVNPILTGVGIADYVTYYAEAALILASLSEYASAFYALTPVHSLPPVWGLTERMRGRSSNEEVNTCPSMNRPARADSKTDVDSDPAAPAACAPDSFSARPSGAESYVTLYPWYRAMPVSATHTLQASDYNAEHGGNEVVEWRCILAPSPAEISRDQHTRAWAIRLSLVLLTLAFGGGNPRAVDKTETDAALADEREVDWRGMNSAAVSGHVCFPNPIFYHLAQTTRLSLDVLLAAAADGSSTDVLAYLDLLHAVAQRNVARARAVLAASCEAVFAADMTSDLAKTAVEHYLPLHILLDAARMYARVPLRVLMERVCQSTTKEEEAQQARDVLKWLAELCATGELQSCHVGTTATTDAAERNTTVDSFMADRSLDQLPAVIDTTSISLTLPPAVTYIRLCARIVSQQPLSCNCREKNLGTPSTPNASLLRMLTQLQTLQQIIEADHSALLLLH
ncbi:hypothetical protein ABL78_3924 [Leptomonas seymouri]|uniref:Uncharacterized protein n=1 Tax=Leptomonas seymouri TaxID=5684 RepID=A0A0N1PBJ6_LEPSE|nr:hypothetical protein ABL78_3924 [Leptomonas seymouri]|eukprot:KPI87012.1 hypothetical protein ABL78_3924 [Leptomonas seymouri]